MALKRLKTDEMIQLSAAWVSGGAAHASISTVPELTGLVQRIEELRSTLIALQPQAADPKIAALSQEAAEVDLKHDAIARGIHTTLSGFAMLAADSAEADRLAKLRDALLPEGLEMILRSYRAQAGAAERVRARLEAEPELRAQFDAISVGGKPMSAHVDEWIATGLRLGEIETERGALAGPSGPSVGAREVEARNQWIRTVNALLANAALAGIEGEVDAQVFGALRIAERNADRRGRSRGGEEPAPAPDGSPTA